MWNLVLLQMTQSEKNGLWAWLTHFYLIAPLFLLRPHNLRQNLQLDCSQGLQAFRKYQPMA